MESIGQTKREPDSAGAPAGKALASRRDVTRLDTKNIEHPLDIRKAHEETPFPNHPHGVCFCPVDLGSKRGRRKEGGACGQSQTEQTSAERQTCAQGQTRPPQQTEASRQAVTSE